MNHIKPITKAVIPCGGLGTRFLPITKTVPKELLPVIDMPVLGYIVSEAVDAGITDILIILGKGKESIRDYFSPDSGLEKALRGAGKTEYADMLYRIGKGARVSFAVQEKPLGSGDAVLHAEKFVNGEPFALALGDDLIYAQEPAMGQLMAAYRRCGACIIGVQPVLTDNIVKYGVADIGREHLEGGNRRVSAEDRRIVEDRRICEDRRSGENRRACDDRRSGTDRRTLRDWSGGEDRRICGDRRTGFDRRSGDDRRVVEDRRTCMDRREGFDRRGADQAPDPRGAVLDVGLACPSSPQSAVAYCPPNSLYPCCGIVEKPPLDRLPSRMAALGRYILTPEIFDVIRRTPLGENGELQLTDSLNILAKADKVFAFDFIGKRYDMGDKFGSVLAVVDYAARDKTFGAQFREFLKEYVKGFSG